MRLLAALICFPGLVAASVPSIPPPVAQSVADCASPVYASDHLVCADASLRALDRKLSARLAETRGRLALASDAAWEDDTTWFRRSRRCAFEQQHRRCLVEAYEDRLTLIGLAAAPSATVGQPVSCAGAWGGKSLFIEFDPQSGYSIIRGTGAAALMAVAAPQSRKRIWQPFAVLSRSASRIQVMQASAAPISCSIRKQIHARG